MGEAPITESVITERVKWTHVEAPDDAAVRQLVADGLPATLVAHALDIDEVPRIDREGRYKLVVLRVLATRTDRLAALRTVALGVMIAPGAVYTITRGPTSIAARLASSKPDRAAAVLVEVLAALAAEFLAAVREIDRNVEVIEGQLANSQRNREVLALLEQQKGLVRIVTALRANRIVADRLVEDTHIELDAEARDRLGDVGLAAVAEPDRPRIAGDQELDLQLALVPAGLGGVVVRVDHRRRQYAERARTSATDAHAQICRVRRRPWRICVQRSVLRFVAHDIRRVVPAKRAADGGADREVVVDRRGPHAELGIDDTQAVDGSAQLEPTGVADEHGEAAVAEIDLIVDIDRDGGHQRQLTIDHEAIVRAGVKRGVELEFAVLFALSHHVECAALLAIDAERAVVVVRNALLELDARLGQRATRGVPAHLRVAQFEIVRIVRAAPERSGERQRTEKPLWSVHAVRQCMRRSTPPMIPRCSDSSLASVSASDT